MPSSSSVFFFSSSINRHFPAITSLPSSPPAQATSDEHPTRSASSPQPLHRRHSHQALHLHLHLFQARIAAERWPTTMYTSPLHHDHRRQQLIPSDRKPPTDPLPPTHPKPTTTPAQQAATATRAATPDTTAPLRLSNTARPRPTDRVPMAPRLRVDRTGRRRGTSSSLCTTSNSRRRGTTMIAEEVVARREGFARV